MADYLIHDSTLEDIADAIRAKTGGSSLIAPEDMADEIESIETGGGSYDGFEIVTNANNDVTEYIFHGTNVPNYALDTIQYNKTSNFATLSFADKPTNIGARAFYNAKLIPDFTNLSEVRTAGQQAFMFNSAIGAALQSIVANLPEFTGLDASGALPSNIFSVRSNKNYFQTFNLPKMVNIPKGAWYGIAMDNINITIGSIGYGVVQCGVQPFDGTSNANGTVTIYTTGSLLDSIKSNVQNGIGSNLTVVYKASEATTYNGTTYAAGDTMLTV